MACLESVLFIPAPIIIAAEVMIENPPPDPWHFPRDELATRVVDTLESGIVSAITLFAPRRMGKTQFVCTDLGPLATRKGWLVAYCNLWDDKANPTAALLATLTASAEPFRARGKTGKVGVAANLGGGRPGEAVVAERYVGRRAVPRGVPGAVHGGIREQDRVGPSGVGGNRLLVGVVVGRRSRPLLSPDPAQTGDGRANPHPRLLRPDRQTPRRGTDGRDRRRGAGRGRRSA